MKSKIHENQKNNKIRVCKNLILILALTLTLSCCNKDDNPFSSNDTLPPETQTGANTVGCLLNGAVFLPYSQGLSQGINCFYQLENGEFFFNITCADFRGTIPKAVVVETRRVNLQVGQTYTLNRNTIDNGDFTGGGGNYDIGASNRHFTNSLKTGELKITRLDLSNSIISGTFWFDAVNADGENVQIRSGRFDMHY